MKVIAKVADCYSPLTLAQCKALKQSFDGIGRYLGAQTHKWDKATTSDELKIIHDASLKFIPIWEGLGQQMKRGLQGGLLDGAQALIEMRALGITDKVAVYFACDYDAQPGEYPTISAYMDGVRKSLNGHYLDGLYAGAHVLDNVKASRKWEAVGWQYGEISKYVNMRQVQENVTIAGVKVDISEIYSDIGWWPDMADSKTPKDVAGTQWETVATWAVENGVMFTYADGTFKPDQPVSRGQVAASLYNLYKLLKG